MQTNKRKYKPKGFLASHLKEAHLVKDQVFRPIQEGYLQISVKNKHSQIPPNKNPRQLWIKLQNLYRLPEIHHLLFQIQFQTREKERNKTCLPLVVFFKKMLLLHLLQLMLLKQNKKKLRWLNHLFLQV